MIDLIGFGHSAFGKHPHVELESLMAQVARQALDDAGMSGNDMDAVVVGHFNPGLVPQGFTAGLCGSLLPGLRFKPATRVENACATGSAAVHMAAHLIQARQARRVLVIGVEIMSTKPTREVGTALLQACYVKEEAHTPAGFAGMFAQLADAYAQRWGDPRQAMAQIAAKNHCNGAQNPLAQLRYPLEAEFCATESEKNPRVVGRFLRSDCSPVSDGAAAVVVSEHSAHGGNRPFVRLRATAQTTDLMPLSQRDISQLSGTQAAWQQLMQSGGTTLDDLDLLEAHDCFTIAELMQYEAIGLTPSGQGHRALDEGWVMPGGRLPVNLSGGLKSKGHPVGATGVSMHVLAAWQLLNIWRSANLPRARLGAVLNIGGAGVCTYGSLLERMA
jgi:acetyl-CoA C-acetyltransferase